MNSEEMPTTNAYKKLLFEHEVLWARYEIREHYLNQVVQEVYENIGQVLSLARMQLSMLATNHVLADENRAAPEDLVGKAIADLRNMCRSFYPETELLAKQGLVRTLEYEMSLLGNKQHTSLQVEGNSTPLVSEVEIILFRMLQEILLEIRKTNQGVPIEVKMVYQENSLLLLIKWDGRPFDINSRTIKPGGFLERQRFSLTERAHLIGGHLEVHRSRDHFSSIELSVPFKTTLYE